MKIWTLAPAIALFASTIAEGALLFSAGATSFEQSAGSTFNIPIYLEATTAADVAAIADDDGLFSVGFVVTRTTPLPSQPATITGLTPNTSLFDKKAGGATGPTSASLWQEQDVLFGNGALPDGQGRILLGTLSVVAGDAEGEQTHFTITDYSAVATETLSYAFTEFDGQIQPGAFVVSTAVPEPVGLGVAAMAAVGLLGRHRMARR